MEVFTLLIPVLIAMALIPRSPSPLSEAQDDLLYRGFGF